MTENDTACLPDLGDEWITLDKLRSWIAEAENNFGHKTMYKRCLKRKWQEMWIAERVAHYLNADAVKHLSEHSPDFLVKIGDEERPFEATEVMDRGRKRDMEYRSLDSNTGTQETWTAEDDELEAAEREAPGLVIDAISKKLRKCYPSNTSLAIYLNLQPLLPEKEKEDEIVASIRQSAIEMHPNIREILLLFGGNIFCIWRQETGQSDDLLHK